MAKTRLIPITDPAELAVLRAGDLSVPHLVEKIYVNADEWKAWRTSQSTSGVPHE